MNANTNISYLYLLKLGGVFCILTLILSYVLFQARFLLTGPEITLIDEPKTEHHTRTVVLQGTAHNITHLWLNDRPIYTDERGNFKEELILENSYTIATLRAKDRFDRENKIVRSFVYTPASVIRN
jgi:hypothetical protein